MYVRVHFLISSLFYKLDSAENHWHPVKSDGDVSKVAYFLDIAISIADSEFKIKSLYSNDLILNIASKSKETVQKLKFLDSPVEDGSNGLTVSIFPRFLPTHLMRLSVCWKNVRNFK